MSEKDDKCDVCGGHGNVGETICPFCNGTGEWSRAAQAYFNNHICQCIMLDRKFCPVCGKKCHHTSSQSPKQTIDPGYGGIGHKDKYNDMKRNEESKNEKEEEGIIA